MSFCLLDCVYLLLHVLVKEMTFSSPSHVSMWGTGYMHRTKRSSQVEFKTKFSFEIVRLTKVVLYLFNQHSCRLYHDEVSKSKTMNELLGIGVGAFQGMANLAINGLALVVLYYGGSLLAAQEMEPGDLMSFLVATQTIQRYITPLPCQQHLFFSLGWIEAFLSPYQTVQYMIVINCHSHSQAAQRI